MELKEIYETLRNAGLCATQAEFSQEWLGRSGHSMSQIDGDPRKASLTSLLLLVSRLELAKAGAQRNSDEATYRKLRGAFTLARTIYDGVFELRHVPRYYRVTSL